MHIPALITDLAVMMLTAGIITIVFKKIKQPLVLGYILAGFLLSPYFPWFADIVDTSAIETWSEIGIIFLMFHLGLEFNMHKLQEIGSTAIITCIVNVVGMLGLGVLAGSLLGFSGVDSIVLGAMLSMSSTMVIIKVFDEKGISGGYTTGVFGTLVMQDIVGIFMMVILSTLAVSKNISGAEVVGQLLMMLLYLVIWLILGIYLLPTFLDKTIKYMNDEMLMVLSIGICFGMVLLANFLGFSSALGAFLSGSLLAGTMHVERIEHLTKGIKDLFGAVFFISVGMMVDPSMIVKYIVPIIVLVVVTIVGKVLFNALGMILSGKDLDTSVKSGFALAQIGEFAFIIANLGNSLGVVHGFLYPIAVAVSVITIFTTPICISLASPFTVWLEKALPEAWIKKLKENLELVDYYFNFEEIRNLDNYDSGLSHVIEDNELEMGISGLNFAFSNHSTLFKNIVYVNIGSCHEKSRLIIDNYSKAYGFDEEQSFSLHFQINYQEVEPDYPLVISLKADRDDVVYSVYHLDGDGNIIKCRTKQSKDYVYFIGDESGDYVLLRKDSNNIYDLENDFEHFTNANSEPDHLKSIRDLFGIVVVGLWGCIQIVYDSFIKTRSEDLWKESRKLLQTADCVQEEKPKN